MGVLRSIIMLVAVTLCIGHAQAQPSRPQYSAQALYNLANSYARAGKPGLAVLNYERAALLAPNDADIDANLEYVRAAAHITAQPRSRFARLAQAVSPTIAAWAGIAGIALLGFGVVTASSARLRSARFGAVLIGSALIAWSLINASMLWPSMHAAVVLIDRTPARVSPVPMGETAFVLPEAETVRVVAEHEDYTLVRTRSGQSGWVARASLGTVVPPAGS